MEFDKVAIGRYFVTHAVSRNQSVEQSVERICSARGVW